MNKKTTGIVAYITWIGWIIAFFAGDKEGAKFHLNQALVIFLAGIVCSIIARITIVGAIIGGIASIVVFIFWIMGLGRRLQRGRERGSSARQNQTPEIRFLRRLSTISSQGIMRSA